MLRTLKQLICNEVLLQGVRTCIFPGSVGFRQNNNKKTKRMRRSYTLKRKARSERQLVLPITIFKEYISNYIIMSIKRCSSKIFQNNYYIMKYELLQLFFPLKNKANVHFLYIYIMKILKMYPTMKLSMKLCINQP